MDKHFKATHKRPENRFDSKRDLNVTDNEAGDNADGVDKTVTEEEYDGIPVDDEEEVELPDGTRRVRTPLGWVTATRPGKQHLVPLPREHWPRHVAVAAV